MDKYLVDRIVEYVQEHEARNKPFDSRGMYIPSDLIRWAYTMDTCKFCECVGEIEARLFFWVNHEKHGSPKFYEYVSAWGLLHDCLCCVAGKEIDS